MKKLPIKNLFKRPGRTIALLLISIFLAFSVFAGSLMVLSLRNGLDSLNARLGADIIVVPRSEDANPESILLQGVPGYFYMDRLYVEKLSALEGVERVSAQYYLATADSGCCSMPVQLIGFDPKTDFTIQPWISKSYKNSLKKMDVVVGSDLAIGSAHTVTFYGQKCNVVAKLEKTGTSLDSAIYADYDTIEVLLEAAVERGFVHLAENNPKELVSSVLIKTKEGYDVGELVKYINREFEDVNAVKTKNMISGLSKSMAGISDMIGSEVLGGWVLSLLVMTLTFAMITNERRKEFAILRVMGSSKKGLAYVVLKESFIVGIIGGILGIAVGSAFIFPFSGYLKERLELPFLVPNISTVIIIALLTLFGTILAGPITSFVSAVRVSRIDTGLVLREGN